MARGDTAILGVSVDEQVSTYYYHHSVKAWYETLHNGRAMTPRRLDLRFDVAATPGLEGPQSIAGWLFPPRVWPEDGARLVVCLPGGTYTKWYFDVQVPGRVDYSMARYLVDRGWMVLALDHLGVGDSTHPNGIHLTSEVIATANHRAVTEAVDRLRAGRLHESLPPAAVHRLAGMGHSMGGMLTIKQQARWRTFDRIAVLGWGNVPIQTIPVSMPPADARDYCVIDRALVQNLFHCEDVPNDVIASDNGEAVPVPRPLLADTFTAGCTREDATQIEVPVFIAFGDHGEPSSSHLEPSTYEKSHDVTFVVLEHSGHCHNFASSRHSLWSRIATWLDMDCQTDSSP
jgi:pimeloyl-ACP methyl ester carboxylesterase